MITIHVMQNLTNETTAVIILIKVPLYPLQSARIGVRHTQRKHFDTTRERDKIKDFSTFI
jgi:hypothetical protein